ncbi:MAG: hypothetical protein V7647_4217 [Acidobacteriota bacterium]
MKKWNLKVLFGEDDDASRGLYQVAAGAVTGCEEHAGSVRPRVTSVSEADHDDDFNSFEVLVELAPGISLFVQDGDPYGRDDDGDDAEDDAKRVVTEVEESLAACMPRMQLVSETLQSVRHRARQLLSAWQKDGIAVRLLDVHLAQLSYWRSREEPAVVVLLEALDDRLLPQTMPIQLESIDDLEMELRNLRDRVTARHGRRIELTAQGASGRISQLALNAIGHFGDVATTIRRFADEPRFWLPDGTVVIMQDGHVEADPGVGDATIECSGDWITARSLFVPAALLARSVGRPVTQLLDHPFLSDEMIVQETASGLSNEGGPSVRVKVHMPQLLFCSTSGTVWPAAAEEREQAPQLPADQGKVVAFPGRRK